LAHLKEFFFRLDKSIREDIPHVSNLENEILSNRLQKMKLKKLFLNGTYITTNEHGSNVSDFHNRRNLARRYSDSSHGHH
jgi:hypothetical protein